MNRLKENTPACTHDVGRCRAFYHICVLDFEIIEMTFKAIEVQSDRLQDPLWDRSVEAHPTLRAALVVVALDVRRALVDRLHEQARARVPAVLRALVVVAALEPPAPAAVHAVLQRKRW